MKWEHILKEEKQLKEISVLSTILDEITRDDRANKLKILFDTNKKHIHLTMQDNIDELITHLKIFEYETEKYLRMKGGKSAPFSADTPAYDEVVE